MNNFLKSVPFIGIIAIHALTVASSEPYAAIKMWVLFIGVITALNATVATVKKLQAYFLYGISGVILLGTLSLFIFPKLGLLFLQNAIACLYVGLFFGAFLPPLIGKKPFTSILSMNRYPRVIHTSRKFLIINLILNYIWAFLFALAFGFTLFPYTNNQIFQSLLSSTFPLLLLIGLGVPITIKLPAYLIQTNLGGSVKMNSTRDLFAAMPYALNKDHAAEVDAIIQFELTGEDAINGYLIIKDQDCYFSEGTHNKPDLKIKAEAELWLRIANDEISSTKAYLNNWFEVEGKIPLLAKLNDLFSKNAQKDRSLPESPSSFKYESFDPGQIRKVVVFDGGQRNNAHGKTRFMVDHFIAGAKEAGAETEIIELKKQSIRGCIGCYTCWTKTPGTCVFNDDMSALRTKYREADLVVFASPLYIFNVTGLFKTFMDRLLPIMKPYMVSTEDGITCHPDRFPECGKQGLVVFSAAGFPEISHNFEGLTGMFHNWVHHNQNLYLLGEFFLPAAELIAQPLYENRKIQVQTACYSAGQQVVQRGSIDRGLMETVADSGISKRKFHEDANYFWETLDGKAAYLTTAPRLEQ